MSQPVPSSPSSSTGILPPATPSYVLRGHSAAIHTLRFIRDNEVLISGDSDGWLVLWGLSTKRPMGVWRAHQGGLVGVDVWVGGLNGTRGRGVVGGGESGRGGTMRVVTHGRDHKLRVWMLTPQDLSGSGLDTRLPLESNLGAHEKRKEPWLLHSVDVSALNFAGFAMCYDEQHEASSRDDAEVAPGEDDTAAPALIDQEPISKPPWQFMPVLFAVPNLLDTGGVDFFQLPSERRVYRLPADKEVKTGMVMALSLFHHSVTGLLTLIAGYEAGHTIVYAREPVTAPVENLVIKKVMISQPHSQPVLSLDLIPDSSFVFTSAADAVVAKLAVPTTFGGVLEEKPVKAVNTKHAGQQGLCVRSDGKIFATAGWDSRVRIYSTNSIRELAVLKWHNEGCYAVAFATVKQSEESDDSEAGRSLEELQAKGDGVGTALDIIKHKRGVKAQSTHWLAAGGKDGKVSLWDIY